MVHSLIMKIIRNGKLDLELLHRLEEKPELFSPGDLVFWTDPYISSHVLDAHLDPESDDASRRAETIQASHRAYGVTIWAGGVPPAAGYRMRSGSLLQRVLAMPATGLPESISLKRKHRVCPGPGRG